MTSMNIKTGNTSVSNRTSDAYMTTPNTGNEKNYEFVMRLLSMSACR